MKLLKLKELHLNCFYFTETGSNLFPALTSMNVPGRGSNFIPNLACEESLHTLTIDDYDWRILPLSHLLRFKNLRRLELLYVDWYHTSSSVLDLFAQFPHLETLVLNGGMFDVMDDVLGIPVSMPRLRKLLLDEIWIFTNRRSYSGAVEKRLQRRFKKFYPKLDVELTIYDCWAKIRLWLPLTGYRLAIDLVTVDSLVCGH